jgi:hypothetical protein
MNKPLLIVFVAFLSCCSLPSITAAQVPDLVFLGLVEGGAPAIESNFDRRIRDALSVSPEFHLADYQASRELRRRINFDDNPVVSRRLVESLQQFTNDSTVFAWAVVRENTMRPVRQWVIKSAIKGDLTLTLNVYSLRFRDYTFIGDVHATYTMPKEFIFFYPLERGTHLSALDRSDITAHLVDQASFHSAELISAVVRSELLKAGKAYDTAEIAKKREESISDMFKMPSVEPASVEVGRKKPASGSPAAASPGAKQANKAPSAATKEVEATKAKQPADSGKSK